jgi:hypothetical protein
VFKLSVHTSVDNERGKDLEGKDRTFKRCKLARRMTSRIASAQSHLIDRPVFDFFCTKKLLKIREFLAGVMTEALRLSDFQLATF